MKHIHDLLAEHPFFAGLAPADAELVAGCGMNAVYRPGEYLARAGHPAEHFFLLRHGRVAVELATPGRDAFVFETLSEGEVLGWSWIIEPHLTQFDARAVEESRVIRFDGRCLRGKCDADPRLGFELMKRFSQAVVRRLHDTRLQLMDVYGARP